MPQAHPPPQPVHVKPDPPMTDTLATRSSRSRSTHTSRSSHRKGNADKELAAPKPQQPTIEGVYKMEDDGLMQRFLFVEEVCPMASPLSLFSWVSWAASILILFTVI